MICHVLVAQMNDTAVNKLHEAGARVLLGTAYEYDASNVAERGYHYAAKALKIYREISDDDGMAKRSGMATLVLKQGKARSGDKIRAKKELLKSLAAYSLAMPGDSFGGRVSLQHLLGDHQAHLTWTWTILQVQVLATEMATMRTIRRRRWRQVSSDRYARE
ncbi:hypothetical protein BDZ45DRAFT_690056 [Acephala macrosclerotiorum]|nr:hypothetical protein BDZ45DRAFT_690056 [Acephala macrosclerotiorum]